LDEISYIQIHRVCSEDVIHIK